MLHEEHVFQQRAPALGKVPGTLTPLPFTLVDLGAETTFKLNSGNPYYLPELVASQF